MLIKFKSRATADILMFGEDAHRMMRLIGKNPDDARGVVTVEQLPGAIAAIESAIAASKATDRASTDATEDSDTEEHIRLDQRAMPFLTLLKRSLEKGEPVLWGV